MDLIPSLITEGENKIMIRLPKKDEVKEAVFQLSGDSAAGLDEFSGLFFQKYWDITGDDIPLVVIAFFVAMSSADILHILIWY